MCSSDLGRRWHGTPVTGTKTFFARDFFGSAAPATDHFVDVQRLAQHRLFVEHIGAWNWGWFTGQNRSDGLRQGIEVAGFNGTGWKLCGQNFRDTAVVVADDGGSDRQGFCDRATEG